MMPFRALLGTGILGVSLLVCGGSAAANTNHGPRANVPQIHGPQMVRIYRQHRPKVIKTFRHGRRHTMTEGYYVRRHGHSYWVKHHRKFHHRHGWRAHRRDPWGHGPKWRGPHTVIIEREVEVERERPSIQFGSEEISVTISFP